MLLQSAILGLLALSYGTGAFNCNGKKKEYYPHSSDCTKYYRCVGRVARTFTCPAGLVFNPEADVCDWPYNYDCQTGLQTTTTNSPQPSTTRRPVLTATTAPRPAPLSSQSSSGCPRRVCYYTNWSQYRPTDGKFVPEDVDPMMCTHLIFAFATLKNNLLASYEWNDESTPWMKGMYERLNDLKTQNPQLKTLLAVGGWNMASKPFTKMVANQARRQKFADHSVIFLKKHGFDGLDLDWEYPARRGSPPEDKARFAALVRQLRQTYDADAARNGGTPLLLTAAVPAVKDNIDAGYNVHAIIDNLDFISLMAYDFHGGTFDSVTGPNSPLFAHFTETGKAAFLNVDWAARYWVDKGAPKHKLVIGVPVYGRTFTLTSFTDTDLGAPSRGGGNAGTYTREKGFLAYYEICTKIATANVTARIQDMKVPYLVYNSDQWVGYDDAASLREKVRYIRKHGFGGVMVWALPLDDFSGKFCRQGKYPLWSAVVDECGN